MTGKAAITHYTRMIKDSISETLSVMARAAISGSVSMSLSIRRRFGVNASASIVAGFTRLVRGIQQAVVENTTGHFETHDTMAANAIVVRSVRSVPCAWMADRWITWLISCGNTMAGITADPRINDDSMVGVGIQKTGRGMTVTAIGVGDWVIAGWDVG